MKRYNGPSILCAVLMFGAVLVSPAFADMNKADEAEMAQIKASVTGAPIKKDLNCVEKDGICQEMNQDSITSNKGVAVSSPAVNKTTATEPISVDQNIGGQTTGQFYLGVSNSTMTGGITSVKSH